MPKNNLQKPVTLETLGQFTEEVLLKSLATKDDLKDLKKMVTKVDLRDELEKFEGKMATRFVTKDYLDKKLYNLEESIVMRINRKQSKFKEGLILVMGILRKGGKPTKKEAQALSLLEQELSLS